MKGSEIRDFNNSLITAEVKEYLKAPEMAEVAQAADVWIAKMGGSSSAEALAMKKQVLSVSILFHPWEDRNALANHECGLADPFDKKGKLLPQIQRACSMSPPTREIPNWEKQLMRIVNTEPVWA